MSKKDTDSRNQPRVTLRDIARETGVSHVTVSRALRDSHEISDATKQRVKDKAREMGYSPDPMLSALANYRLANQKKPIQSTLAWINLFEHPEELRTYNVFNQYWEGASETARQLGFNLEEFRWVDLPAHRLHGILKTRGIRGLVLTPSSYTDVQLRDEFAPFPWENYATVRFGQSARFLNVNLISSAQASNAITAFERVRDKGYERIGFVGEYIRKFFFSAGYLWAQQAAPEHARLPPCFCPGSDVRPHRKQLDAWIKQTHPDAIICASTHLPDALESLGHHVPNDIALCTLTMNDAAIDAGMDQNPREIGRAAIRAVVSLLNENSFGIPTTQSEILVEGRWIDGSMLPKKQ